jgi:hypothetical protein
LDLRIKNKEWDIKMEQIVLEKVKQDKKKKKKRSLSNEDFALILFGLSVAFISFLLILFFGQNMTLAWIM